MKRTIFLHTALLMFSVSVFAGKEGGGGGGFCNKNGCITFSQTMTSDDFESLKALNSPKEKSSEEQPRNVTYWQPPQVLLDTIKSILDAQPMTWQAKTRWMAMITEAGNENNILVTEKKDGFGRVIDSHTINLTYEVPQDIDKKQVAKETKKYREVFSGIKNMSRFKLFAYRKPWHKGNVSTFNSLQTILLPDFFQIKASSDSKRLETQALTLLHESLQRHNFGEQALSLSEIAELDGYLIQNYRLHQAGKASYVTKRFMTLYHRALNISTNDNSWEKCRESSNGLTSCNHTDAQTWIDGQFFLYNWTREHGGVIDLSSLMNTDIQPQDFMSKAGYLFYRLTVAENKIAGFIKLYPRLNNGIPYKTLYLSRYSEDLKTGKDLPSPGASRACGNKKGIIIKNRENEGLVDIYDCNTLQILELEDISENNMGKSYFFTDFLLRKHR